MILLLDNYDSFTYNLYQYLGEVYNDILVLRNDEVTLDTIRSLQPEAIIFSPGPGRPSDAGNMEQIISQFYKQIPMLGICLGHQAIGEVFGAEVVQAKEKLHGETSTIQLLKQDAIFAKLPQQIPVGRYHSLILEQPGNDVFVTAVSQNNEIMAIQHKQYPVYGVQFHPESLLTPHGKQILKNFIEGRTIC